jgi:pimeloyl-ACP methyl ester carboxylesterase
VSTPPFLEPPDGVDRVEVPAASGSLAALAGSPDTSPPRSPVLLVPGFTGSKEDFIGVLAAIRAAGHPLVAIDQRGQYESPGDGDPASDDMKALAEDVLAVARHLGGPVHLLGHSFGGLVARAATLADPGAVRSLTLMSSGPAAIPHPSASNLQLVISVLPGMDLEAVWAAKRQLEAQTEARPPEPHIEEWMHRRYVTHDPICIRRMAELLLSEEDRVGELAQLRVPTHVIHGVDDDAWTPAEQAEMARRLDAAHTVVEGAAHSPAAERPEATAEALVAFWASLHP